MNHMRHTTWERLYSAVEELASGEESIQIRVRNAYLTLSPLMEREFPEELQEEFEYIKRELTNVNSSSNAGDIEATIRGMSSNEASEIARKILGIYETICIKYCSDN